MTGPHPHHYLNRRRIRELLELSKDQNQAKDQDQDQYDTMKDLDDIDHFLNETASFSTASPSLLPENSLLIGTDNNTAFLGDTINAGTESELDQTSVLFSVLSMGWLVLMVYCFCGRSTPRPELWRGAEIRERYLRMREQEQKREIKDSQTPEHRHRLVQHNLRTKRVIAKDAEGNWTLGSVSNKNSPAKTKQFPLEFNIEEDDEDEHACVICLEPFQVGDVVSWSRYSKDCYHVYHAECIQPWLEDKRQDECPSCRNNLVVKVPASLRKKDSPTKSEDGETIPNSEEDFVSEDMGYDEDDEPSDRGEDDSFFVIMHGLVSRAAKRASYSLICSKDSSDENFDHMMGMGVSSPSPLRRVFSHGSVFRRRSSPSSNLSQASFHAILRNCSTDSDDSQGMDYDLEANSSSHADDDDDVSLSSPLPLRQVRSDMGSPRSPSSRSHHRLGGEFATDQDSSSSFASNCSPGSRSSNHNGRVSRRLHFNVPQDIQRTSPSRRNNLVLQRGSEDTKDVADSIDLPTLQANASFSEHEISSHCSEDDLEWSVPEGNEEEEEEKQLQEDELVVEHDC